MSYAARVAARWGSGLEDGGVRHRERAFGCRTPPRWRRGGGPALQGGRAARQNRAGRSGLAGALQQLDEPRLRGIEGLVPGDPLELDRPQLVAPLLVVAD